MYYAYLTDDMEEEQAPEVGARNQFLTPSPTGSKMDGRPDRSPVSMGWHRERDAALAAASPGLQTVEPCRKVLFDRPSPTEQKHIDKYSLKHGISEIAGLSHKPPVPPAAPESPSKRAKLDSSGPDGHVAGGCISGPSDAGSASALPQPEAPLALLQPGAPLPPHQPEAEAPLPPRQPEAEVHLPLGQELCLSAAPKRRGRKEQPTEPCKRGRKPKAKTASGTEIAAVSTAVPPAQPEVTEVKDVPDVNLAAPAPEGEAQKKRAKKGTRGTFAGRYPPDPAKHPEKHAYFEALRKAFWESKLSGANQASQVAPSAEQLTYFNFMSETMRTVKHLHPELSGQEQFKVAVAEWHHSLPGEAAAAKAAGAVMAKVQGQADRRKRKVEAAEEAQQQAEKKQEEQAVSEAAAAAKAAEAAAAGIEVQGQRKKRKARSTAEAKVEAQDGASQDQAQGSQDAPPMATAKAKAKAMAPAQAPVAEKEADVHSVQQSGPQPTDVEAPGPLMPARTDVPEITDVPLMPAHTDVPDVTEVPNVATSVQVIPGDCAPVPSVPATPAHERSGVVPSVSTVPAAEESAPAPHTSAVPADEVSTSAPHVPAVPGTEEQSLESQLAQIMEEDPEFAAEDSNFDIDGDLE